MSGKRPPRDLIPTPRVIENFAAEFARCGCTGEPWAHDRNIFVLRARVTRHGWWELIECLECGTSWHEKTYIITPGVRRALTDHQFRREHPTWP